ncbi:MAG: hypothetical protein J7502_01610 [Flavisolibacter sp.]|nr:hypothetical protein [Flavisolibacter sp.]
MKKILPCLSIAFLSILLLTACSRKHYAVSYFDQKTAGHKIIAVLPAEMIFTGTQPKDLSAEDISKIEENESRMFQNYLFNSILRYANDRRYYTAVGVQDISTTEKLLEDNNISIRNSWKQDDKKLAKILGVDAVVRMRIQKKRYMSDLASLGVDYGQQVLNQIGNVGKYIPNVPNKTNDMYASCNVISDNQTLWNDDYRGSASYNVSSERVIDNITDNFGKHFPYRKRR